MDLAIRHDAVPVADLVDAAADLGLHAHHLRAATASQLARLEGMAAQVGEVLAAADTVANGTASSAEAAEAARDRAREGEDALRAMVEELTDGAGDAAQVAGLLDDLVSRLGEMTSVVGQIDQIASQTRLLALNAAIEAARAGHHGAGFTATTLGAATVAAAGAPEAAAALEAIGAALHPVFDVPREHAGRLIALVHERRAVAGQIVRADLAALDEAMCANLTRFAREVHGATVTVAPGLLADDELWMQWWAQGGLQGVRPLVPEFDPSRPDFYDYRLFDWFTVPVARGRTCLSDPTSTKAAPTPTSSRSPSRRRSTAR